MIVFIVTAQPVLLIDRPKAKIDSGKRDAAGAQHASDLHKVVGIMRKATNRRVQDFLVEDHPISRVGDHLNGSLAEPKATSLTRPFSCWQVFAL